MYHNPDLTLKDFTPEVVNFLRSGDVGLECLPEHWSTYLGRAIRNLPRCYSKDDNANANRKKVTDKLYSALICTQQALVYLERACGQFESKIRKARELLKNYTDQSKLMISTREAQKKVEEKA